MKISFVLKTVLITLLYICTTSLTFAQIKGRILKESNTSYPNITVILGKQKAVTNIEGWFFFSTGKIGDVLIIDKKQYVVKTIPFMLSLPYNRIIELDEVVLTANRRKAESIHFNRNDLNRFRGTANGDLFNGIPGLQVNNIRNEAGALDIGIRGIQGEGRVPVLIDGGLQSTQTFRGYQGSSDRTYIDMGLIRKVKVNKGASFNSNAIGATGGVVEMTTIGADDIVLPENKFGVYAKGSIANNGREPKVASDPKAQQYYVLQNKIKESQFNNHDFTLATAYKNKDFDVLVAYSMRNQGNHFAGDNGAERYGYNEEYYDDISRRREGYYKTPEVRPGQEVVNSSYKSQSVLTKLGWDIGTNQRLEANYRYHNQKAGEMLAALWYKNTTDADQNKLPDGVESMPQWSLGAAIYNNYGLDYKYYPSQSVNLHISLFANDGNLNQHNGLAQVPGALYGDVYLHKYKNLRKGLTAENTMFFNVLPLTLKYGTAVQIEKMQPLELRTDRVGPTGAGTARHGKKEDYSFFASGDLKWRKFLFRAEGKIHHTRVHDYTDDKKLDYGLNADIVGKITYTPYKWLNVYGKASNIYRSPSLFESTKSNQTFSYIDSLPLKPEATLGIEIGAQTHFSQIFTASDAVTFGAGAFYNNTSNYLSTALTYNPNAQPFFLNYDRYRLKGFDLNVAYESPVVFLNASAIFYGDPLICSAFLGEQEGVDKCTKYGFDGSVLPSRIPPKRSFNISSGVYALNKKLSVGARIRYRSKKEYPQDWLKGTAASGVIAKLPADYLLDFFGSYKINSHININYNVDNLTDRYQYDAGSVIRMPVPGRTIRVGLEANF